MKVYENEMYRGDVGYAAELKLPWNLLKNSNLLISGASGLVGSCLIDVIMCKNRIDDLNCTVYALGRNKERAEKRFGYCIESKKFIFCPQDINVPIHVSLPDRVDYVLHLASNTHPVAYATDPIGTVTANIIGTKNMLDYAAAHGAKRFVFVSSNEIYGENRGDVESFSEDYLGYINCNTLRAGYPESKRCGETLCQSYLKQKSLDVVIPRLTRSYGPTMLMSDTKAISQFIKKGIKGENIVLKSQGTQYYSYTYVVDAVSGILTVLLKGESGEAYNVASECGDIRLKDLAALVAAHSKTSVIYEIPDETEKLGYSTATKARINGDKLKRLGWEAKYDITEGVKRTLDILGQLERRKENAV